jgi:hypothetical protein
VLALPGLGGPVLPLRADGFLGDFAVVRGAALTLGDVECVLGAGPAADAAGVAAFGVECRQALETLRLRARHLPATLPPGPWLGAGGTICYDAVAATRPAARLLRARVLEAGRLPVKAMLTAGTLTGKDRTGASDINKFYGPPGPNYLRDAW